MAKRPKLSKNQRRQVQKNRDKRLQNDLQESMQNLGEQIRGRVISRFGKQAIVESCNDLSQHKCFIRRTIESLVCGDYVQFRPSDNKIVDTTGIVEVVEERKSALSRPDYYDGIKPVAANVEQIIIVSSILPEFSPHIIDRYLVACEHAKISPVIVLNKIELLSADQLEVVNQQFNIYQELGYPTFLISCKTNQGIDEFNKFLINKVSVFVGQSGVGKSSLINALMPEAKEVTGEVSINSGLGQHTTTAAKLMHFSNGGELIDSPGVREFGLWHLDEQQIAQGFIEFREYLGGCKFSDCRHKNDPGCLIVKAVDSGDIHFERYQSFLKIIETLAEQRPTYAKS